MRKLATIRVIDNIKPIKDADNIELAVIDGWQSVVRKNEFKAGQRIIYCEIDSLLPTKPEYEFLRKSCYYKDHLDQEWFRLKTIRLRGEYSQGLILPCLFTDPVGTDLTDRLGIEKYEPPIPAQLAGLIEGQFPFFIKKTDEERIQNLIDEFENFNGKFFYISEKLDGTSATFYWINKSIGKFQSNHFGVCSRNLELKNTEENTYWNISRKYHLEEKLRSLNKNIAIQGEICGPGIQKNYYNLKEHMFFIFNIYDIDNNIYLKKTEVEDICNDFNLDMVPFYSTLTFNNITLEDLLNMASEKSFICTSKEREGLVFVNDNIDRISFKVINNKFLLKNQ